MDKALTRSSRLLALGGIASVLFGIAVLVWPNIAVKALIALFGAFALVAGVFAAAYGLDMATEHVRHWVPMLLAGIASILIGVYTFFRPDVTALVLLYMIGAWAILFGIFQFVAGVELTGEVKNAWLLALAGVVSVAFGVYVAVNPGAGALAVIWLIGLWAIATGILQMGAGFQLGRESAELKKATTPVRTGATT